MQFDQYAYLSGLRHTDPMLKLVFALPLLGIAVMAGHPVIHLVIIALMAAVTVLGGGLSAGRYARVLTLPASFLLTGVFTVALSFTHDRQALIVAVPLAGGFGGVSPESWSMASTLFLKSLAAFSALSFLSLTTPLVTLLEALRRFRLPRLIVEMMGLTYRFISLAAGRTQEIHLAQLSRLGYCGVQSSYRSLGLLSAAVLRGSLREAGDLYAALEARGYQGELNVLPERSGATRRQFVLVACLHVSLAALAVGLEGWYR